MSESTGGPSSRQHLVIALLSAWLIGSSPWVSMLRRIPDGASFVEYSHVALGLVVLVATVAYGMGCARGGGWRLYFPRASGRSSAVVRDLRGLVRGQIPAAEDGGLLSMVEGLLLIAVLITALSGVAWLVAQGSSEALAWRAGHVFAARAMIGLLIAHVVGVSLHLVELARN